MLHGDLENRRGLDRDLEHDPTLEVPESQLRKGYKVTRYKVQLSCFHHAAILSRSGFSISQLLLHLNLIISTQLITSPLRCLPAPYRSLTRIRSLSRQLKLRIHIMRFPGTWQDHCFLKGLQFPETRCSLNLLCARRKFNFPRKTTNKARDLKQILDRLHYSKRFLPRELTLRIQCSTRSRSFISEGTLFCNLESIVLVSCSFSSTPKALI